MLDLCKMGTRCLDAPWGGPHPEPNEAVVLASAASVSLYGQLHSKTRNIVVAILCRLWHSFVIEGHGSNGVGIQPSSSVE
jgi:hypothetical protein